MCDSYEFFINFYQAAEQNIAAFRSAVSTWLPALYSLSRTPKNTWFRVLDLFPSSSKKEWKTPTEVRSTFKWKALTEVRSTFKWKAPTEVR